MIGLTPGRGRPRRAGAALALVALLLAPAVLPAQAPPSPPPPAPGISLDINGGGQDLGVAVQIVVVMTLLSLAPSIVMLMTSFTRIVIVLGFVRSALGIHQAPSNQIVIGLSLFLTFFIMAPVWDRIYDGSVVPYLAEEKTSAQALAESSEHLRGFMLKQTRRGDLEFFLGLSRLGPTRTQDLPLRVVVPSFVLSELRTAFQMGFLIFVPFIIIDFLVASVLMAMGMMMMPPVIISLPFKLLLFVLVDGWYLIVSSLVKSFAV